VGDGQSATLKAEDGYRWSGTIAWVENEYPSPDASGFFDFVGIHKETTPGNHSLHPILILVLNFRCSKCMKYLLDCYWLPYLSDETNQHSFVQACEYHSQL
jgi:hypothetical protein